VFLLNPKVFQDPELSNRKSEDVDPSLEADIVGKVGKFANLVL